MQSGHPFPLSFSWLLKCLLGALLSLLLSGAPARAGELVLAAETWPSTAVAGHTDLLVDPSGTLTLAQVRSPDRAGRFQPVRAVIADGYIDSAYWLRLRVRPGPGAAPRWWLSVNRGFLDDVRLYQVTPAGEVLPERRAGDRVTPAGAQDVRVPTFAFSLDAGPAGAGGVTEIYLRVHTHSTMIVPVRLMPEEHALTYFVRDMFAHGLFHGASLVLVLAGLGGWVRTRQSMFLLYTAFVLANQILWYAIGGDLHQFVFGQQPSGADRVIAASMPLAGAFGLGMVCVLLQVQQHEPRLWRVLLGVMLLLGAATLAPFLGLESRATPWVLCLVIVVQWLPLPAALRVWPRGLASLRWLVLLLGGGAVLTTVNALLALGVLGVSWLTDAAGPMAHLLYVAVLLVILQAHENEVDARRLKAEARAAEALLQHARERAAREDQSHLLSMIAHEIRTPVSIIDASLQSLRVLDEHITPERARRHERIARALDRMSGLMEVALTQDRLDVSVWTQELTRVSIEAVTREAIHVLSVAAESRVVVQAGADAPLVQVDERMLRFALLNMIDNALKYSPRDSRVDVMIRPMTVDGRTGCQWTVLDQGQGIPVSEHQRVFEKYYRADDTADTPGLGLGLYLVRQIIERHGGRVRVVPSAPGNGTCFECWLPEHQGQNGEGAP